MASKFVSIEGANDPLDGFPAEEADLQLRSSSLPLQLELEPWDDHHLAPAPPFVGNRPIFVDRPRRPARAAGMLLLVGVFAAGIVVGSKSWWRQALDAPAPVTLNLEESAPPQVASVSLPTPEARPTAPDTSVKPVAQVRPALPMKTRKEQQRPVAPPKAAVLPPPARVRPAPTATETRIGRNGQPPREVMEFLPMVAPAVPAPAPEPRQPVTVPAAAPPPQPSSPAPATNIAAAAPGRSEGAPLLPPRAAAPTAAPPRVDEEGAIRATLGQYRDAYERLDASAAKRVWPGVDERALSRAFANLESQSITFDNCKTTVSGAAAVASCRGTATFIGRIGSRNSQTQSREWTFKLQKAGSGWEVQSVQVR